MRRLAEPLAAALAGCTLAMAAPSADAADRIGQVKVVSGEATIARAGRATDATPGAALFEGDLVATGADSAIGMTFTDNSRMSLGANSSLVLESYAFNRPGRQDAFDARLARGSLTAASGGISKVRPLAMRVLTPTTVLGVKGTEFAVRVGEQE